MFAGSAGGLSTGGAPSSPIASGGPLSTVFGHLLSLVTSDGPLSAVLVDFLSPVANDNPLFAVLSRLLSVLSGCLSFLVASSSSLFVISGVGLLSLMPPAGFRALFLTNTPSCAHRFFCPSCRFSIFFAFFAYTACL